MEGQNIAFFREGQGPKDAHLRFDGPPGQSMTDLDGVQGTPDHSIRPESEDTKTVLLRLDGVQTLHPVLKNIVISVLGLEMGTKFGRFGQERNDPVKLRFGHADLEPRATTLLDRCASGASVVNGTNGPIIDLEFWRCAARFLGFWFHARAAGFPMLKFSF
jgi:hypothetical protein